MGELSRFTFPGWTGVKRGGVLLRLDLCPHLRSITRTFPVRLPLPSSILIGPPMNSSGDVEEPVPEITMDMDKEAEEVKKMRNTLWRGGGREW